MIVLKQSMQLARHQHQPQTSSPLHWRVVLGAAILTFVVIISHGCHGDDVDHEPLVTRSLQVERE